MPGPEYNGQVARIPIGAAGLMTDIPQGTLPASSVLRAINCYFENGYPEKCPGSRRWNASALPAGVLQYRDWWPDTVTQRLIAVCSDGKTYRFTDAYNSSELTASGVAPATLNISGYVTMMSGGQEETGNDRKLFIYTGNNPIQVVSGDGTTRRNLATPTADFATTPPIGGIIYRNAHYAWGKGHRIYKSLESNHEDFTSTGSAQYAIAPGDGEFIACAFVYKTRLFVAKYPAGLHYLVDTDADSDNWYFQKLQDNLGGINPQAVCAGADDLFLMTEFTTLVSIAAAFQLGDVQSSDIFSILKNKKFADNEISTSDFHRVQGIYYRDKQQLIYCMRSQASTANDRICLISLKEAKAPKISWYDKDQANCLALIKDDRKIERPSYGANDGYIYTMDHPDRWVGTADGTVATGYEFEVQTPSIDFRELNPLFAEQMKSFDWLEVCFVPTGAWDLNVDVFIDGAFHRTLKFNMGGHNPLGRFYLNQSRLESGAERSIKKDCGGSGRRIAFRCYNSVAGQNIKLVAVRVGFQVAGTEQKQVKG